MSELTYTPVGGTRTNDLAPGFRHLKYRKLIGSGDEVYRRAGEAILTFRMHHATGAKIDTTADRAAPGVRLTVGLGPMRAPCEVIWAREDEERTGWGYGTLPGHPASGEEAFQVVRGPQGQVWFTVVAYSRPASLLMKLGGPGAVFFQHVYARLCGRALQRLSTVKQ